jgi:DinB superfamily
MTLTEVLLTEAETTYAITEKLFRRVSDDELSWVPATGKDWMSVGQLLMHCASFGCGKAVRGFVAGDWGLPQGTEVNDLPPNAHVPPPAALPGVESVEQALELLSDDRDLTLNWIAAAGKGSLLERRAVAPWGGPELPLFQHLLHMIAHLAQHKGQLFYYLKLMGKDVRTVDLWGD